MRFHLISGISLASNGPLIKASEVADFTDAASLLREAKRIADDAAATDAEARRTGYAAGFSEGMAEAEHLIATEAGKFAEAIDAIRAEYAAQVADAAFAATTAIIGELDDSDIVSRIVSLQLARHDDNAAVQLVVSPSVYAEIQSQRDGASGITIQSDPALAPTDCHVLNGQGRIIANLSLQLQMLRERWGLDPKAADTGAAK
jgi:flagellar biosynthesis/type III secretory pathway protein FliH